MKTVDIICWTLNGFMLWSLIYGFVLRKRTRKIIKRIEENEKNRTAAYIEFFTHITEYNERVDLLSKENNKLRDENEMMKERLTNLGLK